MPDPTAPADPSSADASRPQPLLPTADLGQLRTALAHFTADDVAELLGPIGRAAHERGDLAGVARAVGDPGTGHEAAPTATLVRLFLLGADVDERSAADALWPLPLDRAVAAGIAERAGDRVRARLDIRPYEEAGTDEPWWVVSDWGSDVRPGPLARDHVLGVGNAALTLAQATPRNSVGRALDIGTGCGVQALHLSRHAEAVTASDISGRALRYAATTAALSGQHWQLRRGSFTEPVQDERFDLVVANPPFVVSPARATGAESGAEYDYRDSGRPGDAACRDLTRDIFSVLAEGGTGQLLANWIVPTDGEWQERVTEWVPRGSTAWVWQREIADPGEYVALWLRDAGHRPGTPGWVRRYDSWLDWFAAHGVAAIGMGMITLRRDGANDRQAEVVAEDVPQPHEQPIGAEVAAWFERYRFTANAGTGSLLTSQYEASRDLVRTHHDLLDGDDGWQTAQATLRQSHGMRWEIEVDQPVAGIVAACAAGATPAMALDVLAAATGDDATALAQRFTPVLVDLVRRGFLVPVGTQ